MGKVKIAATLIKTDNVCLSM